MHIVCIKSSGSMISVTNSMHLQFMGWCNFYKYQIQLKDILFNSRTSEVGIILGPETLIIQK